MSNILISQSAEEYPDVLKHVASNLRRLRDRQGWSQTILAERSGLSRRMISAIESGAANVSLSSLDRLASALSVTFTQLVRPPAPVDGRPMASVVWEGRFKGSKGVLLGAVPSAVETEFWEWTLAPEERLEAQEGPVTQHDMIYVLEGVLTVEKMGGDALVEAGGFISFPGTGTVVFSNRSASAVRYVRVVVV